MCMTIASQVDQVLAQVIGGMFRTLANIGGTLHDTVASTNY